MWKVLISEVVNIEKFGHYVSTWYMDYFLYSASYSEPSANVGFCLIASVMAFTSLAVCAFSLKSFIKQNYGGKNWAYNVVTSTLI